MTIAEMMVEVGADTSGFDQATKKVESDFNRLGNELSSVAKDSGNSIRGMSREWGYMSDEMKMAYKNASSALIPFKKDLKGVEYDYFKLSQSMKTYSGSTNDFMNEVGNLGKRHKAITDEMMKNNELMKTSFISSIGQMMARSTQSEKIAENFNRMNNPLYKVNNGLLKISGSMEKIAQQGQPAAMALKMLGPTANMKKLNDMTRTLTAGLMRFPAVALIAGAAATIFYKKLHDGAKESVAGYEEAFTTMSSTVREAFQPMVDVFGAVMIKVYEFITAIADMVVKFNEAHPIISKIIGGFLLLLPALTLLLSPLAIGAGLVGGLKLAFGLLAPILIPIIAGFASMFGTVLLVAGVIALVAAAIYLLWTKTSWFKEAVMTAWEAIKTGTAAAWDYILNDILIPVWDSIVAFGQEMMAKFQEFWAQHGEQIVSIVVGYMKGVWDNIQMVMGIIKGIFQMIWPMITNTVKLAWNVIKLTISNYLDIILGLISVGLKILKGDWSGAWESIKGIAEDIWGNIESFFENVDLFQIGADIIGGLLKGLSSMAGAITERVAEMASLIPDGLKDFLGIHSPSRVVAGIMKWVPIGAAEGIENNLGAVTKATKTLSAEAIPSVTDSTFKANVNGSMSGVKNLSYEDDDTNSSSSGDTINLRGIFEGAELVVRSDQDIKDIARELYQLTKTKGRRGGFAF